MAKEKAKKVEVAIPEGFTNATSIPEGFERITAERVNRWFKKSEGAILHGKLIGQFEGSNGTYFQVLLERSALATEKIGEGDKAEKVEVTVDSGEIINVDGHKALIDTLSTLCDDGGEYAIYCVYGAEVSIGKGHTFWPVTVSKNVLKGPTRKSKGDVVSP